MKPVESVDALIKFSKASGVALQESGLREGLAQMFAFYSDVKAVGCDGSESDMLLFQWGVYDWGQGPFFELNITRQFIEDEFEDDDAISQLSLTFKYSPTAELTSIDAGERWFKGNDEFNTFRESVFSSAPFLAALDVGPEKIELAHWYV